MKEEELKRLIEKYYNGETTVEDEHALRDFLSKNNVPDGYEAEKEIFSYYDSSQEIPEPSIDFEARILAGIDASERNAVSQRIRRYFLPLLSAAAGLLILAGSYFFFIKHTERLDTFKDPEIAYAETIKILRDVSSQLNHGAQVLEPVGKMNEMKIRSVESLNKSARIVEKNLKSLSYLQQAVIKNSGSKDKKINK
jgi:hypothetical protein